MCKIVRLISGFVTINTAFDFVCKGPTHIRRSPLKNFKLLGLVTDHVSLVHKVVTVGFCCVSMHGAILMPGLSYFQPYGHFGLVLVLNLQMTKVILNEIENTDLDKQLCFIL